MNKTVIAVVGCGRIASQAHFPAFAQMDNIRIKYACDLIEEKAQAMKDTYPELVEQFDREMQAGRVPSPNWPDE